MNPNTPIAQDAVTCSVLHLDRRGEHLGGEYLGIRRFLRRRQATAIGPEGQAEAAARRLYAPTSKGPCI
jgi:hypothetical protein